MEQNRNENKEVDMFTFLKRVKEGEYAPIETSSLSYTRVKEETEFYEELYYYGIS